MIHTPVPMPTRYMAEHRPSEATMRALRASPSADQRECRIILDCVEMGLTSEEAVAMVRLSRESPKEFDTLWGRQGTQP